MEAIDILNDAIRTNGSMLCIGLDSQLNKMPGFLQAYSNGLLNFNCSIIEATQDIVSSYKLNFAFYEQYGAEGFEIMKKTFDYIPRDLLKIADCKRGDIGNTSYAYASACYDYFGADAVTVSPYMGHDSVKSFLDFPEKLVFILARTSNSGANDFQSLDCGGEPLYAKVVRKCLEWGSPNNIGFVAGATFPDELAKLRSIAPDNVFLIPGIGTQGGNLNAVMKANNHGTAIINVSRAIIYASESDDFAVVARGTAESYRKSINNALYGY